MRQNTVEGEFARALDEVVVNSFDSSTSELLAKLDELEAQFIQAGSRFDLEIKRRIAEQRLILCGERADVSLDQLELFRSSLETLGYSNLDRHGQMEVIFAQFCLDRRGVQRAKMVLTGFLEYLDGNLSVKDTVSLRDIRTRVSTMLDALY